MHKTISTGRSSSSSGAQTVAVVAFDGISPFHLSVPCLVFGEDRTGEGVHRYRLVVCGVEPGLLRTSAGFGIQVDHGLAALRRADIVVVPSWRDDLTPAPAALLAALRAAHRRGARIVGLCLGAFVLAEAGLLDGKSATTHWHWAASFRERFPRVRLEADVLYVDEDRILTSAGTAAGLDCCLYLLQRICGPQVANRVARRLVIAPHRAGGQAQFVEEPVPQSAAGDRLGAVLAWAAGHLQEPHSIDSLAQAGYTLAEQFDGATPSTLLVLDGDAGTEHWITFRNFYVISRYNRSPLYSMAVWQLSQEIARGVAANP